MLTTIALVLLRVGMLGLPMLPLAVHAEGCPPAAIAVALGESVQAAVDHAHAGASFCLKDGVHRMQVVRPKHDQRFYGERHAILNGSRILSAFGRVGSYWVSDRQQWSGRRHGECQSTAPTCNQSQTVFMGGRLLTQVLDRRELATGRFYVDHRDAKLYLADDPRGQLVELTEAPFAFSGTATGVQISGITIEKYASPAEQGAIHAQDTTGWVVENCEIRLNAGAGISVGSGARVRACAIHHNGQIGITGVGHDIVIEANRIWANNTRGFSMGWEAGGVKISLGSRIEFRANQVFDNRGPGLWCDGDCRHVIYEDNVVERNHGAGIFHEISFEAIVRRNVLRHNGLGNQGWFWGNDILISGSQNVEVHGNSLTVGRGKCAIMLIDQGRRDDGKRYQTRNNRVHGNDLRFDGEPCAGGASDVAADHENYSIITEGSNLFDRNTYRVPRSAEAYRFVWGRDEDLDWNGLRRLGLERDGRLILY